MTEDELEGLSSHLEEIATALDRCAETIRDLEVNPEVNLERIGQALALLYDVRAEIWAIRPDLRPPSAQPDWGRQTDAEDS